MGPTRQPPTTDSEEKEEEEEGKTTTTQLLLASCTAHSEHADMYVYILRDMDGLWKVRIRRERNGGI